MELSSVDRFYTFDTEKINAVRQELAWMKDPTYFKRVHVSPSAIVKMMTHGQSGVEKGIRQNGKPVEVMGFLIGRPDDEDPNSLVVTDAQALPIEGFETRVVADDESVINYMIELGNINEMTRKENFCGWYHTHPFDLDVQSHCYLSTTDVSTQLHWQRAEDRHGNPWLALVIDPLRSLNLGRPDIMAFRVYPPEYSPPANQQPDGSTQPDETLRVARWGVAWNRYYTLSVSYFMSDAASKTLAALQKNFMWMNAFTSSAHQEEAEEAAAEVGQLEELSGHLLASSRGSGGGVSSASGNSNSSSRARGATPANTPFSSAPVSRETSGQQLQQAAKVSQDLALNAVSGAITATVKDTLFN